MANKRGKRIVLRQPTTKAEVSAELALDNLPVAAQTPEKHDELLRMLGVPESRRRAVVLGRVYKRIYGIPIKRRTRRDRQDADEVF